MTKLEKALLAQIRERISGLDLRAGEKLAALLPVLERLTAEYESLGETAKKTIGALFPALAGLIEAVKGAEK